MPLISGVTGSPTNTQTGGDEVYQWNGNGTITFSIGGTVQYLIVGGGGGGGGGNFGNCGGGGGAGGLLAGTFTVSDSTYTINVGAGGIAGVFPDGTPSYDEGQGGNGGNSSIVGLNSPAAAIGGGGGGRGLDFATLSFNNGLDGGSGGGEGSGQASATAGLGTTGQGNNGGDSSTFNSGGGGGGASAVGGAGDTATEGGAGGNGTASEITGTSITYAGGGGGGGSLTNTGLGGTGGGGNGHDGTSTPTAGTDGLGGGGGGGRNTAGADGGDGIVIIRFTPETNNIAVISENTIAQNATPTVNGGLPYTGVEDHTIEEGAPTAIDIDPSFLAIYQSTTEHKRALLRATGLSNIPANAIITSATLYLNRNFSNTGDRVIDARRCLQTWDHEDCSWNRFDASLGSPAGDWGTAGADSDGVDRIATATDTVTHSDSDSGYGVATFDLTSDVQSIIDGTISSNEGWLFSTDNIASAGNFGIYISSTGTNFQRPELVVEYSLPPSGSGIKTIGTNGDFATISDWADAVKGENILSENAEGRLTDDKIYDYGNTEDLAFFNAGLNLNGFTVTLRGFGSGIHNSSFGTGARIEASAPFGGLYRAQQCIIEDFSLTNTETTSGGARCLVQSTATVRRTIARTLSTGSNCDVLEFASGGPEACYTEGGTTGIDTTADGVSIVNCTVVDADTGINGASNTNLTVQNNVVYNCTTEYAGTFSTSTVSHNAGEDAVGTQPTEIQTDYVQITSADFENTATGDYRPIPTGKLYSEGFDNDIALDVTNSIFYGYPSIGAFEIAPIALTSQKTIGNSGDFLEIYHWANWLKANAFDLTAFGGTHTGLLIDNRDYFLRQRSDTIFYPTYRNNSPNHLILDVEESVRHNGSFTNGARMPSGQPNYGFLEFEGLKVRNVLIRKESSGQVAKPEVDGEMEFCVIYGSGLDVSGANVRNCLIYNPYSSGCVGVRGDSIVENCTIIGGDTAFTSTYTENHTGSIINCVAYGQTTASYASPGGGSLNGTYSNNATTDGVLAGSDVTITSDPFIDSTNNDYHPVRNGQLDNAGTTASLTTDVIGEPFDERYPIGAFEDDSGIKDIGLTGSFSSIENWGNYIRLLGALDRNEEGRLIDNATYSNTGLGARFDTVSVGAFTIVLRGHGSGVHDGTFTNGAKVTDSLWPDNCSVEDFIIQRAGTGLQYGGGGTARRMLVENTGTTEPTVRTTNGTYSYESCLFKGGNYVVNAPIATTYTNCTFLDGNLGGIEASGSGEASNFTNCAFWNCNDEYTSATYNGTYLNNATENDSTLAGTNGVTLSADPFVDSSTGNYHPVYDGQLDRAGTSTSVTLDNESTNFDDTPAIGAFEDRGATKTIGTLGDFQTITAWCDSVISRGAMTEDNTGVLIDNKAYAEGGNLDKNFRGLSNGGFKGILTSDPSVRHNGTSGSGARIEDSYNGRLVRFYNIELRNIECYNTVTGTTAVTAVTQYTDFPITHTNCIFRKAPGGSGSSNTVGFQDNNNYEGCIFIGSNATGSLLRYSSSSCTSASVRNCTFIASANNGVDFSACTSYSSDFVNNVFYDVAGTEFSLGDATPTGTLSNNAGEDVAASQITTNYVQLSGSPFVDYAGGDYRPTKDGELDGAGTNLSIYYDVSKTVYENPPSIGSFEVEPLVKVVSFEVDTAGGPTGTGVIISKPANINIGDLLMIIVMNGDNTDTTTFPIRTGWTKEFEIGDSVYDAKAAVYTRIADGTEASTETINWDTGADAGVGWYLHIEGAATSNYLNVLGTESAQSGPNTTITANEVTTTQDDCLVFALCTADGVVEALTPQGGNLWPDFSPDFQEIKDSITVGSEHQDHIGVWVTKYQEVAGATGNLDFLATGQDGKYAIQFAIAPPGGATSYSINAETGALILAGQDAFLRKQFIALAESGAIALDGQDASIFKGYNVISDPGALTIDGQDAITRKGYNVVSDTGSLLIDGQDATTRKGYNVISDTGSLLIDGQDIVGRRGYSVLSDPGALTIDGQDATTRKDFVSLSDPGALTIDGQDAITRKGYNVISNAGSLLIDGQDAGTRKGYNVVAEATTITIAGQDSGLTKVYSLNAEDSTITVGGQNATLRKSYNLVVDEIPILINGLDANLLLGSQTAILAETGSFFVNGQDAVLRVTRTINAEATILDIEGQDAVTRRGYNVVSDPGSLTIDGQDATTRKGYNIISESGNITNAGQDSILRKGYVHISESGSLFVAGQSTNLAYGRVFSAESGSIVLTGQDANLNIIAGLRLTADPGAVQVIGKEVQLGETTGNRLLRYSTLASGATALQHFLNINFGTGGGQIEIIETDRIHATVSEDVIVAEISEDIIQATIVENVITAIVSEDTLDSTIEEDTIQGSLTE